MSFGIVIACVHIDGTHAIHHNKFIVIRWNLRHHLARSIATKAAEERNAKSLLVIGFFGTLPLLLEHADQLNDRRECVSYG